MYIKVLILLYRHNTNLFGEYATRPAADPVTTQKDLFHPLLLVAHKSIICPPELNNKEISQGEVIKHPGLEPANLWFHGICLLSACRLIYELAVVGYHVLYRRGQIRYLLTGSILSE